MRRRGFLWAWAALALLAAGCAATGAAQGGEDRGVYHFSEGLDPASNGLRNIGDHLGINPKAKIIVVSCARGVVYAARHEC